MATSEFGSMLAFVQSVPNRTGSGLVKGLHMYSHEMTWRRCQLWPSTRDSTMNHLLEGRQRLLLKVYPRHASLWDTPFVVISEVSSPAVPHETQT